MWSVLPKTQKFVVASATFIELANRGLELRSMQGEQRNIEKYFRKLVTLYHLCYRCGGGRESICIWAVPGGHNALLKFW
jgi:hypothetical protein